MSTKLDKLLTEVYSIDNKPELENRYNDSLQLIKKTIHKLPKFSEEDTGFKKTYLFCYNNMFIWNTKKNMVSNKKISSSFKSYFIKLRRLFNDYNKELTIIKRTHKISNDINILIVHAEVLVNILYLYGWDAKKMKEDKFHLFHNSVVNYYDLDIQKIDSNSFSLVNVKGVNHKKIAILRSKLIDLYGELLKESYGFFLHLNL